MGFFLLMASVAFSETPRDETSVKFMSQDIEEGYIRVTGGKVWYRIVGKKQHGIPLVALHGGPGVSSDYLDTIQGLANARPVIFYDQLGCGRSDLPNDSSLWTVERFVEELRQVSQALKLRSFHLLGQSWGSMLAVEYFLAYPDTVVSLISSGLFHSVPRWESDQQKNLSQLQPEVQAII